MKPPDFLKNLSAPARMLFRPMLMTSLVLHGVVLMLPMPSVREKPEPPKKEVRVKIAQLPTTRPSPKTSAQSSSKPNPQSPLQPSLSTPPDRPTRPEPVIIQQEPIVSLLPLPESSSPLQQQSKYKKEEPQQQLTEQPRRSPSTEQPRRSPSTEQPRRSQSIEEPTPSPSPQQPTPSPSPSPQQPTPSPSPSPQQPTPSPSPQQPTPSPSPSPQQPTPSPSPQQPTPSPSPQQPTPSPSTEQAKGNNEGTGGGYGQYSPSLPILAAIEEIKPRLGEDRLKQFKAERDINKLAESNLFKANGEPDITRFIFLQKALSPLTTQEITSALQTQLKTKDFHCDPKGTYGRALVYEVTQGDLKFYLIFAPGMDDNGAMTAIIFSQKFPT